MNKEFSILLQSYRDAHATLPAAFDRLSPAYHQHIESINRVFIFVFLQVFRRGCSYKKKQSFTVTCWQGSFVKPNSNSNLIHRIHRIHQMSTPISKSMNVQENRFWKLMACTGGIIGFFLLYGVTQERIMTQSYGKMHGLLKLILKRFL